MSDLVERLDQLWDAIRFGEEQAVVGGLLAELYKSIYSHDAELSRLSALVAEWQKAAEPFIAIVTGGDILESEDDDDDFRPFPSEIARVDPLTVGDFRRLSQLKDTTNADK